MVSGACLMAQEQNKAKAPAAQPAPALQPAPPAANQTNIIRDRTEIIARALKLTDEQKAKVKPIIEEETKKLQELRADQKLSPQERTAKMREIRETTYQKMKPILTEEQWKRFYRPLTNTAPAAAQPPAAGEKKQESSKPADKPINK